MKKDEGDLGDFHEEVALSCYLQAIEKGKTPSTDDLQTVGEMARRYLFNEPRPKPKARSASSRWVKRYSDDI